ncbi:hypothetical protein CAPTEDRAFT_214967 [Capitella teleta]|uniref:TNFR-Cys domain-containing protein n=1 Tax=Capitella teleta TaxID=283909 RepID=R7T865_CAPTE|nr:hypothetical protein CAPTEDRAFT_214967 [Capitella teleta]|eukprot:ELT89800.1 hypothetical protein CAPTEDRAFT_214967 [Capitella teleta]
MHFRFSDVIILSALFVAVLPKSINLQEECNPNAVEHKCNCTYEYWEQFFLECKPCTELCPVQVENCERHCPAYNAELPKENEDERGQLKCPEFAPVDASTNHWKTAAIMLAVLLGLVVIIAFTVKLRVYCCKSKNTREQRRIDHDQEGATGILVPSHPTQFRKDASRGGAPESVAESEHSSLVCAMYSLSNLTSKTRLIIFKAGDKTDNLSVSFMGRLFERVDSEKQPVVQLSPGQIK